MPNDDDSDELAKRRRKRADDASPKPPRTPKTQKETGRIPPSGPPRKTAVGYSGDWGYKPGDNVICRIVAPEMGGYAVLIPKTNIQGFLPTDQKLKVGEEVLAQFVCLSGNRVLLQPKLSQSTLNVRGSSPAAELSPVSETDITAFRCGPQPEQLSFRLRRATDLLLPPISGESPSEFKINDADREWLVSDLEDEMRTGCVKASSEEKKSRGGMLLYRGRAVGCIYGNHNQTEPEPTEPSLHMMLQDMRLPNTEVLVYDLPENVILAMSALFLGYPVERKDTLDPRSYFDYIVDWLELKQLTACVAFSMPTIMGTCLGFVCNGTFIGTFYVEEQSFSPELEFIYDLIAQDYATKVEVSILPPEMTSSSVRFGFSLRMADLDG